MFSSKKLDNQQISIVFMYDCIISLTTDSFIFIGRFNSVVNHTNPSQFIEVL